MLAEWALQPGHKVLGRLGAWEDGSLGSLTAPLMLPAQTELLPGWREPGQASLTPRGYPRSVWGYLESEGIGVSLAPAVGLYLKSQLTEFHLPCFWLFLYRSEKSSLWKCFATDRTVEGVHWFFLSSFSSNAWVANVCFVVLHAAPFIYLTLLCCLMCISCSALGGQGRKGL